ncbi:MAG TPA: hypothetical protein VKN62_05880, partial [Pelovirga sp.]|nr:hypothetical protein [Pelovirga sp.]
RGRGQRGEQKFLRHPATATALELFSLWTKVRPDLLVLLQEWNATINTLGGPIVVPIRRKRRRRKKKPAPTTKHS